MFNCGWFIYKGTDTKGFLLVIVKINGGYEVTINRPGMRTLTSPPAGE
jgi:hypothetical protein